MAQAAEIFMQLSVRAGKGVPVGGSARTEFIGAQYLTDGFTSGSFFAVQEFTFGSSSAATAQAQAAQTAEGQESAIDMARIYQGPAESKRHEKFQMEPFTFSKHLDAASPALLTNLTNSVTYKSAAMIKCKVVGGHSLLPYLRIDYTDVLITGIDWSDGDVVVKEVCKFLARGIQVQYLQQADDGSLLPPVSGHWGLPPVASKSSSSSGGSSAPASQSSASRSPPPPPPPRSSPPRRL